ncbi:uncharacterized protein MONOS_3727 [Monocercomonoides exilis]|uniref:uncharacterized protein n=1 Tax=Monocercomonoides exilis TaxID=2049356 RepID=UPI0035594848|nr:hypothetical protein MONOS_3727 [Monocercomonoides exilis]|eukprot:MONOS_3727.1-p1 / transcript=MONOS_3727.1 / gene=MONOS_3727 / organism=Monocercomonoides_exilis_PA203 / gene_product=unspecified product / transcript_product=unspecified product / location=Mono_scaffold00090:124226-124645(-) / protein_length=115 / sequence_SO=supercontig / SO=protein_coding / is_pseudo=false
MSFYVKLRDKKEIVIVEFQGNIEVTAQQLGGIQIGDLNFKDDITLKIGNYLLTGQIIKLEKPFLVLEKSDDLEEHLPLENEKMPKEKYFIKYIIQQKILFSKRPRVLPVVEEEST